MSDDIWLKRWNTLKNYLQNRVDYNDDLDDVEHSTLQGILNTMATVEEMEDEVNE